MDIDDDLSLFRRKTAKKLVFLVVCIFVFDFLFFPFPIMAANNNLQEKELSEFEEVVVQHKEFVFNAKLPENKDRKVKYSRKVAITAYNSTVEQCDDTPCITANGFDVCKHGIEDTVATNMLSFGTKIRIPELFGDKVFVVRDRMNKRYSNRVDVWMSKEFHAKIFGLQYAEIEILE